MEEPYRERTLEGHFIVIGPSIERGLSVGIAMHHTLADRVTDVAYHFRTVEMMVQVEQGRERSPLAAQLLSTHVPIDIGDDSMDRIDMTLQAIQKTRRSKRAMTIIGPDINAELHGSGPLVGGALRRRRSGGHQPQRERRDNDDGGRNSSDDESERAGEQTTNSTKELIKDNIKVLDLNVVIMHDIWWATAQKCYDDRALRTNDEGADVARLENANKTPRDQYSCADDVPMSTRWKHSRRRRPPR